MIKLYRTSSRHNEYWKEHDVPLKKDYKKDCDVIVVNTKEQYQSYLGFGGAFTGATAHVLSQATPAHKKEIIDAYYGKNGLNYNMTRVTIHSSDFDLGNYTYVKDNDEKLESFDIKVAKDTIIPLVKEAKKSHGKDIQVMASAWSAPGWMKTNNEMNLGGELLEEHKGTWARYMAKYCAEMKKNGVSIDMMTIQNEPEAVQRWESMYFSASDEGQFIKNHLHQALVNEKVDDVKLVIWDHNRDRVAKRAHETLSDPEVNKLVWGIGYHWYVSDESINLTTTHQLFPDKHIMLTECCVEIDNGNTKGDDVYLGNWENGERYGKNIIADFNNYCEGWMDWNLVLDELGGPNHVNNYCESPIMYDTKKKEVIYNPSYYYIGHFSKFLEVGAKRVACFNDNTNELSSTSFVNPNGDVVIVIQNEGWIKTVSVVIDNQGFNVSIGDHSIVTLVYKK